MPTGGNKDIRGGGAFWELFAKDNLSPVLDRLKKKAKAFAGFIGSVGKTAAVAGAGLAAPLAVLFKGGVDRAADAARMSQQLGIPVELMSKLQYAAEAAGVSVEDVMNDTEGRFAKLVADAPSVGAGDAKQALEFQREMTRATDALRQAMLPLLKTVVSITKGVGEFVTRNKEYLPVAAAVAGGLLGIAATIKLLTIAFGILGPVASAAWAFVTGPVGLGITLGAITGGGLFLGLAYLTDGCKQLGDTFRGTGKIIGQVFGGVTDALKKGDFEQAWKVIKAGGLLLWAELKEAAVTTWEGTKFEIGKVWGDVVLAAKTVWIQFSDWLHGVIVAPFNDLLETAARAADALGKKKTAADIRGAKIATPSGADTDAKIGKLAGESADERASAFMEMMEAVMKAEKATEEAKKALAEATAAAAAPADAVAPDTLPPLAKGLRAAEAVKGGFSGSALGLQFGASNEAQKTNTLLAKMLAGEGGLPAKIGEAVGDELKMK